MTGSCSGPRRPSDTRFIDSIILNQRPPPTLCRRLWLAGGGFALFLVTLVVGNWFVAPERAVNLSMLGHDFLPFYTAGTFVREGRHRDLYDLPALRAAEGDIARAAGLEIGDATGPFWNPPFYALPFAPLSALPYRSALTTWMLINVASLAVALVLLCRMLGGGSSGHTPFHSALSPPQWGFSVYGLVPLLTLTSMPFVLAMTHGQSSPTSLLLLTVTVVAWRAGRGLVAGLVLGLLSYKPQLAALVALVLVIDLGWRAAAGLCVTGATLGLTALLALPGSVGDYLHRLPAILHHMQVEQPYMWERHATLRAFWRLLVQGRAPGEAAVTVQALTVVTVGALLGTLVWAALRSRRSAAEDRPRARDRLIVATVAVMPLAMPFYFDYDLLLLAVPAVLLAAERLRSHTGAERNSRWLTAAWCGLFVWLTVNADVAERTRFNLAVPLLSAVAAGLLGRALRRDESQTERGDEASPVTARAAA